MEENKVMETETIETTDLTTVDENYEDSSSGKGWIVKAVGAVAFGAAVFGLHKAKGLIEKRTIKKLRKKGYTILEPDECEDCVEEEYVEEPDVTVEPENE